MTLADHLLEPFRLGLMQRALVQIVVISAVGGAVGCFVVIRGLSFTGESLAHTVLPGVVVAYAIGASLLLGAALLAGVTVAISLLAQRDRKIAEDTAMGVAFAGLFPLGVILLALQSNPTRSLSDFLFGDVLANSRSDVVATVGISVVILAGLVLLYRPALASSFDRAYAVSLGYHAGLIDAALLSLVAATVVVAILAVGNVLALALLVAPAATARLVATRLAPMMVIAAALGALCGLVALELSYWFGVAAGSTVVLCAAGAFVLVFLFTELRQAVSDRVRSSDETREVLAGAR